MPQTTLSQSLSGQTPTIEVDSETHSRSSLEDRKATSDVIDYPIIEGTYRNCTPIEEFLPLAEAVGGFDLDACASDKSNLARNNIRNEGGLEADWGEYSKIFINHPYKKGEPEKWHRKAYESDADLVVMLSRGSISADWFHNHATKADLICIPNYRVKFVGFSDESLFPIIYTIYGDYSEELKRFMQRKGLVIPDPSKTHDLSEGKTEIVTKQNPHPQKKSLLDSVSKRDHCTIKFDSPTEINNKFHSKIRITPLTRQYTTEPSVQLPTKQGRELFYELTGVHRHEDGSDTYVVLYQTESDYRNVRCYTNSGHGWVKQNIKSIKTNSDIDQTHSPTSAMSVGSY